MKAVEVHLAAGQESLQEVDPALLEVLRDRGLGLGREPFVVHASRLSPDASTDIGAGPAPGPEVPPAIRHSANAISLRSARLLPEPPSHCTRQRRATARASRMDRQARGNVSRGRYLQMVINAAMTRRPGSIRPATPRPCRASGWRCRNAVRAVCGSPRSPVRQPAVLRLCPASPGRGSATLGPSVPSSDPVTG